MDNTQRVAKFEEMKETLENEGYKGKQCTISVLKANLMAFVTAGPIAVICLFIYLKMSPQLQGSFSMYGIGAFFIAILASIFIHEFIHGITWSLFCKNRWKSIHIGMMWRQLTPFCCCLEPLKFRSYILGGLMPLLILGLGLFGVALVTQNMFVLGVSLMNILVAGGDTTIVVMLLKHKEAVIIDHPAECGFWAFSK